MAVMAVRALRLCLAIHNSEHLLKPSTLTPNLRIPNCNSNNNGVSSSSPTPILRRRSKPEPPCFSSSSSSESESESESEPGLEVERVMIEMEKAGKNTRKIEARVEIEAPLEAVWKVLTDYERLADFIPGLAQSQLLLHSPNYARLFQVGEQKLGLGLKFNAKGVIDCFEKELQTLAGGSLRRDIDFQMVQGDFEVFQGKWSILQVVDEDDHGSRKTRTFLSYLLDVKPKVWLPVRLVEGRLCNEIKVNLASIRRQSLKNIIEVVTLKDKTKDLQQASTKRKRFSGQLIAHLGGSDELQDHHLAGLLIIRSGLLQKYSYFQFGSLRCHLCASIFREKPKYALKRIWRERGNQTEFVSL